MRHIKGLQGKRTLRSSIVASEHQVHRQSDSQNCPGLAPLDLSTGDRRSSQKMRRWNDQSRRKTPSAANQIFSDSSANPFGCRRTCCLSIPPPSRALTRLNAHDAEQHTDGDRAGRTSANSGQARPRSLQREALSVRCRAGASLHADWCQNL